MDTERARIAEAVLSFGIEAPKARSLVDLQGLLEARTSQWGVTHFAACVMMDSERRFTPGSMFGKINVAWGEAYFEHQLYRDDPVIDYALRGGEGAYWEDAFDPSRLTKGGRRVLEMAAGCGASDGYLMPVNVRRGDVMVVSYQGERLCHDPEVEAALNALGLVYARLGQRFQDGRKPDGGRLSGLSHKQVHVLTLSARGLTNENIAEILGIAVKTVEYHLAKARQHLGAANTKEAIAALRDGIKKSKQD